MFDLPFMQRAFLAAIAVGFLASYYGVFVVQRGLSFMGSGLAHAAFGGIALGLLLETEPLWISLPFTILVAMGIVWVRERTDIGNDTAIGIFFSVSMALGIIFLFLRQGYSADAFTYLFGSIVAVSWHDLIFAATLIVVTLGTAHMWKRWAYTSFDRELARTDRLPVTRDDYILAVLIALTVVTAIKIVGILLIAAFLVIPAATSRLVSSTFRIMTILSITAGIITAVCGLILSYHLDVPSGAAIILLQALLFFLIVITAPAFKRNKP